MVLMSVDVQGIDHLYVSVSDLERAERFYDPVMQMLGFRKGTAKVAGEPHLHYFNRVLQYTLRPARGAEATADPYRTGALHHLCFRVRDAAAVDEARQKLVDLGIEASEPRSYPEYRPDYYATFFNDPDGIRLEIVCDTHHRRVTRERWEELTDFVDPVRRLLAREASAAADPEPAPKLGVGNLWRSAVPATGERFEELVRLGNVKIERITSSDAPGSDDYDADHDEWVVLLRGEALLEIEGAPLRLGPGDYLRIPAHTSHRVLRASAGALWLAVHELR